MSKPVKNLIVDSYRRRFDGVSGAVVVSLSGVDANANNRIRGTLCEKQMRVAVVKNNLARRAWAGTEIERLSEVVDGPSAVVFGGESVVDVARALVEEVKKTAAIEFRGALMEGQLFAADEVEALSKYPTRQEAQSEALQLTLSPGQNLAAAAVGPGRRLASILKAIEEKLEKGETISRIGA